MSEPHPDDPSEPQGELRRHEDFPSRFLDNRRTLFVYLPPDYGRDPRRRYPVLYLHDGQNLFDPAEAAFGVSWEAHHTADRLIGLGLVPPLILVGIANTPDRLDEYAPYRDAARGVGGQGGRYGRFVAEEVKPFVDRAYRTRPGREHTGVAGSSMGGLASLALARRHADVFSRCGVLSPSLWWCRSRLLRELEVDNAWMKGVRFWLDTGTREGGAARECRSAVERARRLARGFERAGLAPERDFCYREVEGGEHNEAAWAARFDRVLLFLFGPAA
jgi:predicted alpha/beta superfamily hydrolase